VINCRFTIYQGFTPLFDGITFGIVPGRHVAPVHKYQVNHAFGIGVFGLSSLVVYLGGE
jgi:hypothetical protein